MWNFTPRKREENGNGRISQDEITTETGWGDWRTHSGHVALWLVTCCAVASDMWLVTCCTVESDALWLVTCCAVPSDMLHCG